MTGRDEHVAERRAVDGEPVVDRCDAVDPLAAEALFPAAPAHAPTRRAQEILDARVVAIRDGRNERRHRQCARGFANREPGERRCRDVAVGLGAHALLADRRGPSAPDLGRVLVRAVDGDLLRLHAAATQRRVRRECGEPATDDRAAHGF